MEYMMKSGRPQELVQGQTLLLDASSIDEQFSHASRYDTHSEATVFPTNGGQLIDWIECLPEDVRESHPRFDLLYIHSLLSTQQYTQAKNALRAVEHKLRFWESGDKESLWAEIAALRSYLTLHQELGSRYQETFYHLARIVVTKMGPNKTAVKQEHSADHAAPLDPLSKRELEVLAYIAAGLSNQEIAEVLTLTVGTVKRHVNNIYTKINVHNRIQAVKYAQMHHLLPV